MCKENLNQFSRNTITITFLHFFCYWFFPSMKKSKKKFQLQPLKCITTFNNQFATKNHLAC